MCERWEYVSTRKKAHESMFTSLPRRNWDIADMLFPFYELTQDMYSREITLTPQIAIAAAATPLL